MEALVEIDAGECGFYANAKASCADGQHVSFDLNSNCAKIVALGKVLRHAEAIDAFVEIAPGRQSRLYAICSEVLTGCCTGCIVPAALFKSMQVAAGLSLPRDITIRLRNS